MDESERYDHIGRYRIEGVIGRGSAGVVYRGYDPVLERSVAIKVPGGSRATDGDTTDPHVDFHHEAAIAGQFNHPNVVTIFDVGRDGGRDYMVMEYVPGRTLREVVRDAGALPLDQVLEIGYECCVALDFIHFHGIVHRDVKPGNVMVNPRRAVVKLMDFSVAHRIEDPPGQACGSLPYMAPENFYPDVAVDGRADVFSAGAMLYELLAGRPRYTGTRGSMMYEIIATDPPPVRALAPEVPPLVGALVERATAREPDHRFPSALDFADAIGRAREEQRLVSTATRAAAGSTRAYVGLRRCPWFERFAPEQVNEMLEAGELVEVMPGTVVVSEGEHGDAFYIVIDGTAEARVAGHAVSAMEVGECFGEMALVSGAARTATVVATAPSLLWKITREALERVSPLGLNAFYRAFLEVMTGRLDARTRDVSQLHEELSRLRARPGQGG